MNIQLPTGKTMTISAYEYLFCYKDEEMDLFYQACIAEDLGTELNNPFSRRKEGSVRMEQDEEINIEEIPDESALEDFEL